MNTYICTYKCDIHMKIHHTACISFTHEKTKIKQNRFWFFCTKGAYKTTTLLNEKIGKPFQNVK